MLDLILKCTGVFQEETFWSRTFQVSRCLRFYSEHRPVSVKGKPNELSRPVYITAKRLWYLVVTSSTGAYIVSKHLKEAMLMPTT